MPDYYCHKQSMPRTKGIKDDPVLTRKLCNSEYLTFADRVAVSEILKANNYNYSQTANMLGVEEKRIRKWHDQAQSMNYAEVEQERIEYAVAVREEVKVMIAGRNEKFVEKAFHVKELALQKLKELIPASESVRDMVAAVKVLHEIETGSQMSDDETKALENKPKSVLLQIACQTLNIQDNGDKQPGTAAKRPAKGNRKKSAPAES